MNKNTPKQKNSQTYSTRQSAAKWRLTVIAICLFTLCAGILFLSLKNTNAAALLLQPGSASQNSLWQDIAEISIPQGERTVFPKAYRTLRLDLPALKQLLEAAPMEFTEAAQTAPVELTMPMPDGKFQRFRIVESPMMDKELAEQLPDIKNYSGQGIDDPTMAMRFDITPNGFHAFILSTRGAIWVTPYAKGDNAHYINYYLRDDPRERAFNCLVKETSEKLRQSANPAPQVANGGTLHMYRLAVAATAEYTAQNGGTAALAQAAINTTIIAVNTILQSEVSIRLTLINNTAIIYTNSATDPYTSGDLTCSNMDGTPQSCLLSENQSNLDAVIGSAFYDIGQVFDTGNAGLASLAVVCNNNSKGQGTSPSNSVIVTAHEIAHQFSATHTFNDNTNMACASFNGANQRTAESAYEPGSGSTIMSYGGSCGAANLFAGRDSYFHVRNLEQIVAYTTGAGGGSSCDVEMATGNTGGIAITQISASITVPSRTPFTLSALATDFSANPMPVTVTWEEYDLGAASPPEADNGNRPIFRSYVPSAVHSRTFPRMDYILNNNNIPPATYQCDVDAMGNPIMCLTGESRTLTTRTMMFQVTARDNDVVGGAIFSLPVQVNVVDSGVPFAITTPNITTTSWTQGSGQTVIWNTGNSASPPINCANVKISLLDSTGVAAPIVLAESVPNTGSARIIVPAVTTFFSRIKVESVIPGNFHTFFDISDTDFAIRPLEVFNTNDSGEGSLRQAIIDANSDPGLTVIPFNIPGGGIHTLTPATELPVINTPVILDGWTQGDAGYMGLPLIQLDGTNAGALANGLVISGGNSLVRGLTINSFAQSGIDLRGMGDNKIHACYIGTNATGSAAKGNGGAGIFINNSPDNEIGTPTLPPNIISGNNIGIQISGNSATSNNIENNFIGTDVGGTARVSNTLDGINITNAPNNFIGIGVGGGGSPLGGGNLISGNGINNSNADGIEINGSGASGNHISNNHIGLNVSGTAALFNRGIGINIINAPGTLVGFQNPSERNIIAGNASYGLSITGATATGTLIKTNYFGINKAGTAAVPNAGFNIFIQSANNVIGGTEAGNASRNVISGTGIGIYLSFGGATGNLIQGNYIGTDATGTVALTPNGEGIEVRGANNNIIGGTTVAARNLISGNGTGVVIAGGSTGTLIQGNYIGTTPNGTAALGNRFGGIYIEGSSSTTVGGAPAGAGNVISGNGTGGNDHGIFLASASGNTVQGNFIGTNAAGTAALGNRGTGIFLGGSNPSNNNIIGGAIAAARNIISANGVDGIYISGNGNTVHGNYIGTDAAGTANLGNGFVGVEIRGADNNLIGGASAGQGNLIAFNGQVDSRFGDGVRVVSVTVNGITQGLGNRIRGNAIFSNVRLGIDLFGGSESAAGVSANDSCDADIGIGAPNNLQNFPVLSAAATAPGSTTLSGTLNSTANTSFTLDFYASPACDASNNGEAQTFIGSTMVTTDATCNASFMLTLPTGTTVGGVLTATATDPSGNTSELSACRLIEQGTPCLSLSASSQSFAAIGGTGSVTVTGMAVCPWTAISNNPNFITVTSGANGNGNGTVNFSVTANSNPAPRSGTLTIANQTFTVYQGIAFADVPPNAPFYNEISRLSARGVTLGCSAGNYCPDQVVTREQMAAFIMRARGEFNPPQPGQQRFPDVPPENPFYSFIDRMAVLQITLGCGGGNYCPTNPVLREQMAAFLIRALHEPGYIPPTPAQQRFQDVPPTNPFYAHIEEMAVRQVTLGCSAMMYCPTDSVTRAQMAAFLVRAFNL